MQSRRAGLALAAAAVAAAVGLFIVLSGGGDSDDAAREPRQAPVATQPADGGGGSADEEPQTDEPKPEIPRIVVEGGEPVGGVQRLTFTAGDRIQFEVASDVADHVHLHGYDVTMDVAAGETVEFDVPATIEGVFEVELEERVVALAEITVEPG